MTNKRDNKNIFKHYKGMSGSELQGELKNIREHTANMNKIGIHTTPAHEQSIKYHLSNNTSSVSEAPLQKLQRLVGESESIRHGNLKAKALKKKIGRKEKPIKQEYSEAEEREERGRMNGSQIEK